jgi:hypothetical protein
MTTIGNSTITVTLSAAAPNITLTGTIDAIGPAGTYVIQTGTTTSSEPFSAAVFGPAAGHFTVQNTGTIISNGNGLDFGIVLGAAGTIINTGKISAGNGIAILGTAGAYVKNTGEINANFDTGIYLQGKDNVLNKGEINADYTGVLLGGGGFVSNAAAGVIYSTHLNGIDARAKATVNNTGFINGYASGIHFDSSGTVKNTGIIYQRDSAATISADAGIYIEGGGAVTNNGQIEGGNGIRFGAAGKTSIVNAGGITATSHVDDTLTSEYGFLGYGVGIYTKSNANIGNTGTIIATHVGIAVENAVSTIDNAGLITVSVGYGIYMRGGGTLTNTGTIIGNDQGIFLYNTAASIADTITNSGQIDALTKPFTQTFSNGYTFSAISTAIFMVGAGTIDNAAAGTITASYGIGIELQAENFQQGGASPGSIINAGTVIAESGIVFYGAGGVTNTGTVLAINTGIETTDPFATVFNAGLVVASGSTFTYGTITSPAAGILLTAGGFVTNAATGTILAGNLGIELTAGGTADNAGMIVGYVTGMDVTSGTAINTGTILSSGFGNGIEMSGYSATVYNGKTGFISASTGILLTTAGDVTNAGSIDVDLNGGIFLAVGGTVINSGFIAATDPGFGLGDGIVLKGGGLIVNTGTIDGQEDGIVMFNGGTVIDSGTITAEFNDAITFATGAADLLILSATARTTGTVDGGGGAIELEADGKTIGTISPTQFIHFNAVTIDSAAIWDLAGNVSTTTDFTFVNDGTLKESAADHITLAGALTGTGLVDLSKQGFTFDGSVAKTESIAFTGTHETLALGDPKNFAATIDDFAKTDTIDLTGIPLSHIKSEKFANGTLIIKATTGTYKMIFASPGTFKNETFALFTDGPGTGITLASPKTPATLTPPGLLPDWHQPTPPTPFVTLHA